eukprot:ANDGO_04348.mRNA.1 Protein clueless
MSDSSNASESAGKSDATVQQVPVATIHTFRGIALKVPYVDVADLLSSLSQHPLTCMYTSYTLSVIGKDEYRMIFVPYSLATLRLHVQRITDMLSYRYMLVPLTQAKTAEEVVSMYARQQGNDLIRPCLSSISTDFSVEPRLLKGELYSLKVETLEKEAVLVSCTRQGFKTASRKRTFETLWDLLLSVSEAFSKASKMLIQDLCKLTIVQTVSNPYEESSTLGSNSLREDDERSRSAFPNGLTLIWPRASDLDIRDWNLSFQEARDLPDPLIRDRESFQAYCEFLTTARKAARDIVEGNVLPINPEDPPEAQVFVHNYLFLTRTVPFSEVSEAGSKMPNVPHAYRNVKHELHALRMFLDAQTSDASLQNVEVPPTAVVDYFGHRILVQGLPPGLLSDKKGDCLIHGSVEEESNDGLAQISRSDANFKASLDGFFRKHFSNSEGISSQTKGVLGTDRRIYALELATSVPVETAFNVPESECVRVRPESVNDGKKLEFADLVSGFVGDCVQAEVFALTGAELVFLMHERGLNARALGRVSALAVQKAAEEASSRLDRNKYAFLDILCRREAFVRTCKNELRALMRTSSVLDAKVIVSFFNDLAVGKEDLLSKLASATKGRYEIDLGDVKAFHSRFVDFVVFKAVADAVGVVLSHRFNSVNLASKHPFSEEEFVAVETRTSSCYPFTGLGFAVLAAAKIAISESKVEEGLILLNRAASVFVSIQGPINRECAECYRLLGALHHALGDLHTAVYFQANAFEIGRRLLGEEHPIAFHGLETLANYAHSAGQLVAARVFYERCAKIVVTSGRSELVRAAVLNSLAAVLRDEGQFPQALQMAGLANEVYESMLGPQSPMVASTLLLIAVIMESMTRFRDALSVARRARDILASTYVASEQQSEKPEAKKDGESDPRLDQVNGLIARLAESAVSAERASKVAQQNLAAIAMPGSKK